MTSFDFKSPRDVLAGTVYGEARGGGISGMADVASVVCNRVEAGWNGGTVISVCLAPYQFSCWLGGSDPNRAAILAAFMLQDATWQQALDVADAAIAGAEDKTGGADSYFAVSIVPPYWARPPAKHTVTRWEHSFWMTRPGRLVRAISAHAANQSLLKPTSVISEAQSVADALDNEFNPGVPT